MPWLAGTALLHSAVVMEKRNALKIWTLLLAILAFSLSLIGTFLVRSGVPTNTVRQAVVRNRLLNTSAPSREIGANSPPCLSMDARQANSDRLPPMNSTKMQRMNTPRLGSLAKVCTEVSTPERTKNVPINDSEKVRIASRMVQIFSALRFSITTAECNSAVPASHGMNEAFSTGSQNQKPPQPSV